jgi:hypothetical protein
MQERGDHFRRNPRTDAESNTQRHNPAIQFGFVCSAPLRARDMVLDFYDNASLSIPIGTFCNDDDEFQAIYSSN